MITDEHGDEWATYPEAARSVRVREDRVRGWVSRGTVRATRVGRAVWVHMGDVRAAETRHTRWKRARRQGVMTQ